MKIEMTIQYTMTQSYKQCQPNQAQARKQNYNWHSTVRPTY